LAEESTNTGLPVGLPVDLKEGAAVVLKVGLEVSLGVGLAVALVEGRLVAGRLDGTEVEVDTAVVMMIA
jgi:hypothetical protein